MPAMAATGRWDRASLLPVAADGRRRAEIVQLAPVLPELAILFTFMRDAELRFASLRLRLEERTWTGVGEQLRVHDVLIRHPGRARVTVRRDAAGAAGTYEAWSSDGSTVRVWKSGHRLATERPARARVVGLEDPDLPGASRAYRPLTALPANSPADTFVHPAGFCQNVLATGACVITGMTTIAGREAIGLTCAAPRTIELNGDQPDHRFELAVDRETGLLVALHESFGAHVARAIVATDVSPDAPIPDSAFAISVPADAASIY